MAGLWDRIRGFFRGGRSADGDAQIEQAVRVALMRRVTGRAVFTAIELAQDIVPREERSDAAVDAIASALDRLYVRGYFGPFNYARSIDPRTSHRYVYHPAGTRVPGATLDPTRPSASDDEDSEPPPPPRRASPAAPRTPNRPTTPTPHCPPPTRVRRPPPPPSLGTAP